MVEIDGLIAALNRYLNGQGSMDDVENATTPFIIDDTMLQDENLRRIVYLIDMHDVEELRRKDLENLRDDLVKYYGSDSTNDKADT